MPIKGRRDTSWTPPSLINESFQIDDEDFIQDPEQQRDQLPQPYRMLDKLMTKILDNAWEQISDRESDRVADASRFRPPQYECAVHVEDDFNAIVKTECLSATPDGQYIILGLQNGLAAVKASMYQVVDFLSDERVHVSSIQTCVFSEDIYLIATIDDMGACRLFALAKEKLLSVTNLNELDASNKVIVSKLELAQSGDFLSVFMEKPSNHEGWLEVHKLPKEAWLKDLESLANKAAAQQNTSLTSQAASQAVSQAPTKSPTPSAVSHDEAVLETSRSSEAGDVSLDKTLGSTDETREHKTQGSSARSSHSFASSTVLMKVSPPSAVTASSFNSVQQASKGLDNNCDVIGTGANHLISTGHLETRHTVFKDLHEDLIKYLPEEKQQDVSIPTIHYLKPGRILPQGLENTSKSDQPGSVAVWWSNDTRLMVYSLHKQSKDLERKPDFVVPLSSALVASALSADGTQLVLAVDNNNLVLWDMYFGGAKGVCHLCDEGRVTNLCILDPSVCPQTAAAYPPYPTSTSYYIMVTMDNGSTYLVNSSHMRERPKQIDLNIVKPDELTSMCEPLHGIPDLLVTCRQNGCVYLHDVHRGDQICQVVLPPDYELVTPWHPLIAVGADGGILYLKGQPKPSKPVTPPAEVTPDDDGEDATPQEAPPAPVPRLFAFQLRSFPTLDKYRARERPNVPFVVHSVVNNRIEALFKHRLSQHGERVSQMQARWTNLKKEVDVIQQLRTERQEAVQQRQAYAGP